MKKFWAFWLSVGICTQALSYDQPPVVPYESRAAWQPVNRIDELMSACWKAEGVKPARVCSDSVFVRRAYLDVIGTLPTVAEVKAFLDDTSPKKRQKLIDRLLQRKEFADYWALKWCDLLRVKSEFPINLWPNAVQCYHRWVRDAVRENMPYDRFVRTLLTSSGSNFRNPPVNFYRAVQNRTPEGLASAVALTFMGVRTHKWPEQRLKGMAAFFSQVRYKKTHEWKEEIVYFDPFQRDRSESRWGVFPDGTKVLLQPGTDPRVVFADWLIRPDNRWFTQNIVNRLWFWVFGQGIIDPPDDIRPDNPPVQPQVLQYLQHELVASHYDLKHLLRLIFTSRTYQLSFIPQDDDKKKAARLFAYYPMRRLEAEVLIDAICQVTGTHESYSSRTPEPYTFIPESNRTIQLADGSISSTFLELFGRPPRDTGLVSERKNRMTPSQRLHLLNSSHIQNKIVNGPNMRSILRRRMRNPRQIIQHLYLLMLSRYPTNDEIKDILQYSKETRTYGKTLLSDVAWALLNSPEFLYRH